MKCGKPVLEAEKEYCPDCEKHNLSYDQGKSVWVHKGAVAKSIYQFKYKNKRNYGKIFAREMGTLYMDQIKRWEIQEIIPVPIHKKRRRKRGYNQTEIVVDELGKILGLPVNKKAVVRIHNTTPQKNLDRINRVENLKEAFEILPDYKPLKKILIVDDIYTTGSTIHTIAKILKENGAEKVYFLTISIGQKR